MTAAMPKDVTINTYGILRSMSLVDAGRTIDLISLSDISLKLSLTTVILSRRWRISRQAAYKYLCRLQEKQIAVVESRERQGYTIRFTKAYAVPYGCSLEESPDVTASAEETFLLKMRNTDN